jgi:hypothetical protein
MPNFRVEFDGSYESRVWEDPAAADKPSRITGVNDQQHHHIRMAPGSLDLRCILDGQSAPVDDASGGVFESWGLEWASAAEPPMVITPGFSSIITATLDAVGHYTIGIFHHSAGSPAVYVHLDVESTP